MSQGTARRSWWHTLPGVLAGIAGLLTATGGLLIVLKQAGVLWSKPAPVHVTRDPQGVSVPSVLNLTSAALTKAGLCVGQIEHIAAVPRLVGRVTGQDPRAGAQVDRGREVKLYVGRPAR